MAEPLVVFFFLAGDFLAGVFFAGDLEELFLFLPGDFLAAAEEELRVLFFGDEDDEEVLRFLFFEP